MYRQRRNGDGDLEVLCRFKNQGLPAWKSVTEVGDCPMYTAFVKRMEEEKEERRRGRNREEKYEEGDENEFEIEDFLCVCGDEVLVLWRYWDEPTWEPLSSVSDGRLYFVWRLSSDYIEINEESEEEEEEETSSDDEEGSETETESE